MLHQGSPLNYAIAVAGAALAVAGRMLLDPFVTGVQFITFFPAVVVVAYLCGSRPGLLTAGLCTLAGWYLFLEPVNSFAIQSSAEAISLTTFVLVSSVMALAIGGLTAALDRERRQLHRQQLLIDELNHRVKNNLSIVQGIARQTLKPEVCNPKVRSEFDGRLLALASAHEVLTRGSWEAVQLAELITNLLSMMGADEGQLTTKGPPVLLQPKAAVSMTLAIHELATNAIKFGALSVPNGRVAVDWSLDGPELHFRWGESGGPAVRPPVSRGFGTMMLERGLAREFGGKVKLDFCREGVICVIEAPTLGNETERV